MILDELINSVEKSQLIHHPYVYQYFDKLLSDSTFDKLSKEVPRDIEFYHASKALTEKDGLFFEYIKALNSIEFHQAILDKFSENIKLTDENTGVRKICSQSDYVTESYVCNRRASGDEWLLLPHCDSEFAITSMIHYWKERKDPDNSGSLYILSPRNDRDIEFVDDDSIINYARPCAFNIAREVEFSSNSAVCILSKKGTWHGIGPRFKNNRTTVNISLEYQNSGRRKL